MKCLLSPAQSAGRWRCAFFVTATLLVAGAVYEARLPARVWNRFQPERFPWQNADCRLLAALRDQTSAQLMQPPSPARVDEPGLRLERDLGRWLRPSTAAKWMDGTLAFGLTAPVEAGEVAPLVRYGESLIDDRGQWRQAPASVEQGLAGLALLNLWELTGNEHYQAAARQYAHFLLARHPRSRTGRLPYSAALRERMLVDTLGLAVPFLTRYGAQEHDLEATELAVRQLSEFLERAIDETTGLCFHAYDATGGPGFGLLGWTRGEGWLAVGLVELLSSLPPDHPERARLERAFQRLAETVSARQLPDGSWPWALSIPDAQSDSSGTAMLAYAFERGLRLGLLDTRFTETSNRALASLARRTDQHGKVTGALGECQGVGHYPRVFGAYPYAQGFATAALSAHLSMIPTTLSQREVDHGH